MDTNGLQLCSGARFHSANCDFSCNSQSASTCDCWHTNSGNGYSKYDRNIDTTYFSQNPNAFSDRPNSFNHYIKDCLSGIKKPFDEIKNIQCSFDRSNKITPGNLYRAQCKEQFSGGCVQEKNFYTNQSMTNGFTTDYHRGVSFPSLGLVDSAQNSICYAEPSLPNSIWKTFAILIPFLLVLCVIGKLAYRYYKNRKRRNTIAIEPDLS